MLRLALNCRLFSCRKNNKPRIGGACCFYGLALVDFDVVALCLAGVQLARAANLVRAGEHFFPVRDPADGTCQGKDHGEHAGRNADRFQDDA